MAAGTWPSRKHVLLTALAGLATAAAPQAALAVCVTTTPGQARTCSGTFDGDSFTPTVADWIYTFVAIPAPPANSTGQVTINNDADVSGTFIMDKGTSIALDDNANALVISNSSPTASFVALTLNGSIENLDAANQAFDAVVLQNGYDYKVTIGEDGAITGNDDGITVSALANSLVVENHGSVIARGQAGGNDAGIGLLVAAGATPKSKVDGSVTVDNKGRFEALTTTLGGPAIHVAAQGAVEIKNAYVLDDDRKPVDGTGIMFGGTNGIEIVSGTSVLISNKGFIRASAGDGVQAYVDGTEGGVKVHNEAARDDDDENPVPGKITTLATGDSGGDGIDAAITNADNEHDIDVKNEGIIDAMGKGIVTNHAGSGTTTIVNNTYDADDDDAGIDSKLAGISAIANGGAITIYNGDGSKLAPSGDIDAGENGIEAENKLGGSIEIFNGTKAGSGSAIKAFGDYGILAQTSGANADAGSGVASVHNFAFIEAVGENAKAAIRAVASAEPVNSYASFENEGEKTRVNAYKIDRSDPNNPVVVVYNANGIELVKDGGSGGKQIGAPYYGAVFNNTGGWNFNTHPVGDYLLESKQGGGIYAPGGSAVSILHTGNSDTFFFNAGTIIGKGDDKAVIDIQTAYDEETANRVLIDNDVVTGSKIYGVMGSTALPAFFGYNISAQGIFKANLAPFGDAADDYLLHATGAPVFLENAAFMAGVIELDTEAANTVNNFGLWFTRGINTFYEGGGDVLANISNPFLYGVIQTAFEADEHEYTEFRGLEQFQNSALLNMIDGGTGDETRTTGDYVGQSGRLGVDAFLGSPGKGNGARSDVFMIDGDSSGRTGVVINDLSRGAGYFNPQGIMVVHVEGTTDDNMQTSPPGNFYLANGPIDKGFFNYDLYRVEENSVAWYLASGPNARAFELAQMATGAQTIWYQSTGAWLDRTADLRRTAACSVVPNGALANSAAPGDDICYQGTYGTWARAFGGDFDRSASYSTSVLGVIQRYAGDYDQSLWGFEGGADMMVMRPSSGYGTLWVGGLAGFVSSNQNFTGTGDKAEFSGGMLGAYGTWINGPWYADLLFKADLLDVDYKTTFAGASASSNANTYGLRLDVGYRFNLAQGWFVDPEGTIGWANANIDDMTLLAATANLGSQDSVRGRLGGRVGTSWAWGSGIIEPFAAASVWREFAGNNTAGLTSAGVLLSLSDTFEDTWGEVGGGVNYFGPNGTSLFFKGDALVAGELAGFNLKGGGRASW